MRLLLCILTILFFLNPLLSQASQNENEIEKAALINRIKPVGEVNTTTTQPSLNAQVKPKIATANKTMPAGEATYKQYCAVCHATGIAGAPKFGNNADWSKRIKKGINALIKSVTNGLNAMPPKGTCNTCTADDFKAAIEYMLPKKS